MIRFFLFVTILVVGVPFAAKACDCMTPTEEFSQQVIDEAYLILRGSVSEIIPLGQHYGVLSEFGGARALIDVDYAYDQSFSGPLYVDYNRTGSNCDIGVLEAGTVRDFIVFKDEKNTLYMRGICTDLTVDYWKTLHEKAAMENTRKKQGK